MAKFGSLVCRGEAGNCSVPHEDNIHDVYERKEAWYEELVKECEEADWCADYFPVEGGCRGFIAPSPRGNG